MKSPFSLFVIFSTTTINLKLLIPEKKLNLLIDYSRKSNFRLFNIFSIVLGIKLK